MMRKKLVQSLMVFTMVSMAVILLGCGKKGPLVMQPNLTPPEVENLQITQEGLFIKLKWNFPEELVGKVKQRDKKKKEFQLENIKKIHIYYSEKEILYGKFRKKSKLLRKLVPKDLQRVPKDSGALSTLLTTNKKKKKYDGFKDKEKEIEYSYFVKLPFPLEDLTNNKHHFFGVQYFYGKKKSLISKVVDIHTTTPVMPVAGLTASRENKLVTLKWNRPAKDASGNPIDTISGYKVYRKVVPEKSDSSESNGEVEEEPLFKLVTETNLLVEHYQDSDTGTNGKYVYYVTVAMSPQVQSAPSDEVTISITDTYPPEIPANLVTFKAADHLFLTWQEVPDQDVAKYKVYRRTTPEGEFSLLADDVTSNQFKDRKVDPGVTYYYVVTAVDEKGNESGYSNIASEQY